MEVLPALVVLAIALAFLWVRHRNKQVTASQPERGRASAPSPRDTDGHSGYLEAYWEPGPAAAGPAAALRLRDPGTGEELDGRAARLPDARFEVVDVTSVDADALARAAVAPGVPVVVHRPDDGPDDRVEIRAGDSGDVVGSLDPADGRRIGSMMDGGRRLEGLVLQGAADDAATPSQGLRVLVADRGVVPPVPEQPEP